MVICGHFRARQRQNWVLTEFAISAEFVWIRVCFLITGTGAQIGGEVRLIGSNITAEDLADLVGTISYEVLTNLSARVPRVYLHA